MKFFESFRSIPYGQIKNIFTVQSFWPIKRMSQSQHNKMNAAGVSAGKVDHKSDWLVSTSD